MHLMCSMDLEDRGGHLTPTQEPSLRRRTKTSSSSKASVQMLGFGVHDRLRRMVPRTLPSGSQGWGSFLQHMPGGSHVCSKKYKGDVIQQIDRHQVRLPCDEEITS